MTGFFTIFLHFFKIFLYIRPCTWSYPQIQ